MTTTTTTTTTIIGEASSRCFICGARFSSRSSLSSHHQRRHARALLQILRREPANTYAKIFGREHKSVNEREMRFGDGIVVTMAPGPHFGNWYDFVNDEGGGPLSAIQRKRGVGFLDSVQIAADMTQMTMEDLAKVVAVPDEEFFQQTVFASCAGNVPSLIN